MNYKFKGGCIMYFPINDILNNTTFGIENNFTDEIDSIINQILAQTKNENEA